MTFNDEQFAALAPYEKHFVTATRSDYSRNPGPTAVRFIQATMNAVRGTNEKINVWCGRCVLRLLKEAGAAWLEDKAERETAAAAPKEDPAQVELIRPAKIIRHFSDNASAEAYCRKLEDNSAVKTFNKYLRSSSKYAVMVLPQGERFTEAEAKALLGRAKNYAK